MKTKFIASIASFFLMAFILTQQTYAQQQSSVPQSRLQASRVFDVYVAEYSVKIKRNGKELSQLFIIPGLSTRPTREQLIKGEKLKTAQFDSNFEELIKTGQAKLLNRMATQSAEGGVGGMFVGHEILVPGGETTGADAQRQTKIIRAGGYLEAKCRLVEGATSANILYEVDLLIESKQIIKNRRDRNGIPLIKGRTISQTVRLSPDQTVLLAGEPFLLKNGTLRLFAVRLQLRDYEKLAKK